MLDVAFAPFCFDTFCFGEEVRTLFSGLGELEFAREEWLPDSKASSRGLFFNGVGPDTVERGGNFPSSGSWTCAPLILVTCFSRSRVWPLSIAGSRSLFSGPLLA